MKTLIRDVHRALRALARTPGFTLAVVLTFAIGIGANIAVFSALDAVLLRGLPYPNAERLISLSAMRARSIEDNIAPTTVEDWNRLNSTFEAIAGYYAQDVSETSGDLPEKVRRATVGPRFFEVLGLAPTIGRRFVDNEHRGAPAASVLISERFWRARFNADPNIVGHEVRVDSVPATIVGVLPSAVAVPDSAVDLWRPQSVDDPFAGGRDAFWYDVIGRLKSGVSIEQARADLNAVQAQLGEQYPDTDAQVAVRLRPFKDSIVGSAQGSLELLFGAVAAVLLVACANVATMLLTRAGQRQREIAVRLSLGASPRSIVAQLLVETALLALGGAAVGVLAATAASRGLRVLAANLPRAEDIALNGRLLVFAIAAVGITTLLAGLLPALRAVRGAPVESLAGAGRAQLSSPHSTQWTLAGVQVALCVTLLASAGLLLRSARELSLVDPGFEPSRVLAFRMSANFAESTNMDRVRQRFERTVEALAALPGVEAAASSRAVPGVPGRNRFEYSTPDARVATDTSLTAAQNFVSPSYFATLGIPLLEGELCRSTRAGDELLVNRRFVDVYLPGAAAGTVAGLELRPITQYSAAGRIVGVVGDTRDFGINERPVPTVYQCLTNDLGASFLVRTRGEPLAMGAEVRTKLKEIEPLRSVYDIATLEQRIDAAFGESRMRTVLLTLFAAASLALACVGIYGTLSYVVTLGRREIGLRLALGAPPGTIVAQFLTRALRVVVVACVVGALLSLLAGRGLAGMLYGVSPSDPLTLSIVVLVMVGVAALAAVFPALRASRVDPMQALREE